MSNAKKCRKKWRVLTYNVNILVIKWNRRRIRKSDWLWLNLTSIRGLWGLNNKHKTKKITDFDFIFYLNWKQEKRITKWMRLAYGIREKGLQGGSRSAESVQEFDAVRRHRRRSAEKRRFDGAQELLRRHHFCGTRRRNPNARRRRTTTTTTTKKEKEEERSLLRLGAPGRETKRTRFQWKDWRSAEGQVQVATLNPINHGLLFFVYKFFFKLNFIIIFWFLLFSYYNLKKWFF